MWKNEEKKMKYIEGSKTLIIDLTDKQIQNIKEGFKPVLTFCRFSDVPTYEVKEDE